MPLQNLETTATKNWYKISKTTSALGSTNGCGEIYLDIKYTPEGSTDGDLFVDKNQQKNHKNHKQIFFKKIENQHEIRI